MILFVEMPTTAIGHAIHDTEIYIRRILAQDTEAADKLQVFFYPAAVISNTAWFNLVKKQVKVVPRWIGSFLHRVLRIFSSAYRKSHATFTSANLEDLLQSESFKSPLFSSGVQRKELLQHKLPLSFQSEYVCLLIRDAKYDLHFGELNSKRQAYRNTPFEYFYSSIQAISQSGYDVIRMGRDINLSYFVSSRYFELASIEPRVNEIIEIALYEHCKFLLTTGTGPDAFGVFFRKPIVRLNVAPWHHLRHGDLYPLTLVSDYFDLETRRKLTFNEVKDKSEKLIFPYKSPEENGISIRPKTSEILELSTKCITSLLAGNVSQYRKTLDFMLETYELEIDEHNFVY